MYKTILSKIKMSRTNAEDVLKGLTLKVYKFVLRNGKPTGIREVQRSLKLSSPTLATYHLNKLEEAGLLRKNMEGYEVNRVFLQNLIRIRRMLIPKYFFFCVFFIAALIVQLLILRPAILTREYIFAVGVTCTAAFSYLYETIRTLLKKTI